MVRARPRPTSCDRPGTLPSVAGVTHVLEVLERDHLVGRRRRHVDVLAERAERDLLAVAALGVDLEGVRLALGGDPQLGRFVLVVVLQRDGGAAADRSGLALRDLT